MAVLGTRPEVVKLAPILHELKRHPKSFKVDLVWTGQHVELARPFLKLFELKHDHFLNIMKPNQTLADIVAAVSVKLSALIARLRPDILMVQGDTTTAMIAALCAYQAKVKVAHIEAGLRSFNKYHPFPEEKNREIISHLSDLNFAPTNVSKKNLLREGTDPKTIHVVGNSVVDALHWLLKKYPSPQGGEGKGEGENEKLLLVTAHRRESFGEPLKNICKALLTLAKRHADLQIIYPVHPNPNVRKVVYKMLGGRKNIKLIEPLEYLPFIHLLSQCSVALSDSGGVQEEAPCLGKPVLIMREVTERPEGVKAGASKLVGRDTNKIIRAVEGLLYNPRNYTKMARVRYPFGRGDTAIRVVSILKKVV